MTLGIWQFFGTQVDGQGFVKVLPNATVTVKRESDGGLAELESDPDGDSPGLDNPFTTGADGEIKFYADVRERYRIEITDGSVSLTLRHQAVSRPGANELDALTAPAAGDTVRVLDQSAGDEVELTLSDLFKVINELTAEDSPSESDALPFYEAGGGAARKITLSELLRVVAVLTAENSPADTDLVLLYDVDAGAVRRVTVSQLIDAVKATQADMEAETADKYPDAAVLKNHPGVVKAWAKVAVSSGTPSVSASRNILSVTDGGTGLYTLTFDEDLSSAEFCFATSYINEGFSRNVGADNLAAGSLRLVVRDDSAQGLVDNSVSVVVYGDH